MFRHLRFKLSPGVTASPVDSRGLALILSTPFLNFAFWVEHNLDVCVPGTLAIHFLVYGLLSFFAVALFFLGPVLLAHSSRVPLLKAAEYSLGSIPALGVRLLCVLFLVGWLANLVRIISFVALSKWPVSLSQSSIFSGAVVLFLLFTGLQGLYINGKLAQFTIRLSIAFLVAALLRVHEGWPSALQGFPVSGGCASPARLWWGLETLFSFTGPVALLAASFGDQTRNRKDVFKMGLAGLIVPLWATLLVLAFIDLATLATPFYQPSLEPNIMMALWGKTARHSADGYLLISTVTVFGAARFAVMAIEKSLPTLRVGCPSRWVWVGFVATILALRSLGPQSALTLMQWVRPLPRGGFCYIDVGLSDEALDGGANQEVRRNRRDSSFSRMFGSTIPAKLSAIDLRYRLHSRHIRSPSAKSVIVKTQQRRTA